MNNIINLFGKKEEQYPVLFELQECYTTNGIKSLIDNNIMDEFEIYSLLLNHIRNIDDNKHPEDREYNLQAIKSGTGRVLSVYNTKGHKIYINSYITHLEGEPIATETTIMLADEY